MGILGRSPINKKMSFCNFTIIENPNESFALFVWPRKGLEKRERRRQKLVGYLISIPMKKRFFSKESGPEICAFNAFSLLPTSQVQVSTTPTHYILRLQQYGPAQKDQKSLLLRIYTNSHKRQKHIEIKLHKIITQHKKLRCSTILLKLQYNFSFLKQYTKS